MLFKEQWYKTESFIKLSKNGKVVLQVMITCLNIEKYGNRLLISKEYICECCGSKKDFVKLGIKDLIKNKLIEKQENDGKRNTFIVNFKILEESDQATSQPGTRLLASQVNKSDQATSQPGGATSQPGGATSQPTVTQQIESQIESQKEIQYHDAAHHATNTTDMVPDSGDISRKIKQQHEQHKYNISLKEIQNKKLRTIDNFELLDTNWIKQLKAAAS